MIIVLLMRGCHVQALADKVLQALHSVRSTHAFNGIHLRMKHDAVDWAATLGGRARLWQMYKQSMLQASLDEFTPAYVASGLMRASAEDAGARILLNKLQKDVVRSSVRSLLHVTIPSIAMTAKQAQVMPDLWQITC